MLKDQRDVQITVEGKIHRRPQVDPFPGRIANGYGEKAVPQKYLKGPHFPGDIENGQEISNDYQYHQVSEQNQEELAGPLAVHEMDIKC